MKKPIPTFKTDKEAEDFVEQADLTDYDLSGGQVVRFEMRPKDKALACGCRELLDAFAERPSARCPLPAVHPHGDRSALVKADRK